MTVPFRALVDGQIVTPSQVGDNQIVKCPDCGGDLYPRDGDFRARHFCHAVDRDADSCSTALGGESETHARSVALAVAELADRFPDADRVGAEISINVTGTNTIPDTRRADALVEFQDVNPYFGQGLVVEIQHKHHSKDIQGTTHDYLSADFSVVWLTPDDFDDNILDSTVIDEAFQDDNQRAYNAPAYDPWEFEKRVDVELDWELLSSGCANYDETGDHRWERIPGYAHPNGYEYEFCPYCGSRRRYGNQIGRFVYDNEGILAPEIPVSELRDAVIPYPDVADDFDEWITEVDWENAFERCLASKPSIEPCRGPLGIHEWDQKEVIERRSFDDRVSVVLWVCQHCPVHLLTNFEPNGEAVPYILFGKEPDPEWGLSHLSGNPRSCQFRAHKDAQDWDYCSACLQLDP